MRTVITGKSPSTDHRAELLPRPYPAPAASEKANSWCQRIAASLLPPSAMQTPISVLSGRPRRHHCLASLQPFCLQAAFPSPAKPQDICLLLSGWANQSKLLTGLSELHLWLEICAPFISAAPSFQCSLLRVIWQCICLFFWLSGWAQSQDNVMGQRNLSEGPGLVDFEEAKNLQEIQWMLKSFLAGPQVHVQVFLPWKNKLLRHKRGKESDSSFSASLNCL